MIRKSWASMKAKYRTIARLAVQILSERKRMILCDHQRGLDIRYTDRKYATEQWAISRDKVKLLSAVLRAEFSDSALGNLFFSGAMVAIYRFESAEQIWTSRIKHRLIRVGAKIWSYARLLTATGLVRRLPEDKQGDLIELLHEKFPGYHFPGSTVYERMSTWIGAVDLHLSARVPNWRENALMLCVGLILDLLFAWLIFH